MSRDGLSGDPDRNPPREPALEECCKGGCDPCVFDRHYEALDRYRKALRLWQLQHPESADKEAEG